MTDNPDTKSPSKKSPLLGCVILLLLVTGCCIASYVLLEGEARQNIRKRRVLILAKLPDSPENQELKQEYDRYLKTLDSGEVDILSPTCLDTLTEGILADLKVSPSEAWVLHWAFKQINGKGELTLEDGQLLDTVYNQTVKGVEGSPAKAAYFRFEHGESNDKLAALEELSEYKETGDQFVNLLRQAVRSGDQALRIKAASLLLSREDPEAVLELLQSFLASDDQACQKFAEAELPAFVKQSSKLDFQALAEKAANSPDDQAVALIKIVAMGPPEKAIPALATLVALEKLTTYTGRHARQAFDRCLSSTPGETKIPIKATLTLITGTREVARERGWKLLNRSKPETAIRKARLAPLYELTKWKQATRQEQQLAALEVLRGLGKSFTFEGLTDFSCGGQSFTIARLTQQQSGIEFSLIPGGHFTMGPNTQSSKVHIRKPFLISRFELSAGQLAKLKGRSKPSQPDMPAANISWNEIRPILLKNGLRFPSEAEWEYSCRAGTTTSQFWGDGPSSRYAWSDDDAHPITAHNDATNAFGLADTIGNVSEWCEDDEFEEPEKKPTTEAPVIGTSKHKRTRGGDHAVGPTSSFKRDQAFPYWSSSFTGVRPAKSLPLPN